MTHVFRLWSVLAEGDPQKGSAVGIGSVPLVGDRRPVQDVAADPGNRVLGHLPIRKPGPAPAVPFADEEREDVELARGARAPLAIDGLRRIGQAGTSCPLASPVTRSAATTSPAMTPRSLKLNIRLV